MKHSQIKVGEILSSTLYMKVVAKTSNGVEVQSRDGREFEIRGKELIEATCHSSTQAEKNDKITRTAMAAILTGAGDSVFTVVYDKKDGTERTLVGRLLDTENHMGRSNVVDLEIEPTKKDDGHRQVDHRTLKSLTLRGTHYTLKK